MSIRWSGFMKTFLLVALVVVPAVSAMAQEEASKEQIVAGYSYFVPNAFFNGVKLAQGSGFLVSSTTFFTRNFGLQVETGSNFTDNVNVGFVQGGVVGRFPLEPATPFIHGDVGTSRWSPAGFDGKYGISLTIGGGVDVPIYKALSWRVFQADYIYSHVTFVSQNGPRLNPGSGRIATGLVFNFGHVK